MYVNYYINLGYNYKNFKLMLNKFLNNFDKFRHILGKIEFNNFALLYMKFFNINVFLIR